MSDAWILRPGTVPGTVCPARAGRTLQAFGVPQRERAFPHGVISCVDWKFVDVSLHLHARRWQSWPGLHPPSEYVEYVATPHRESVTPSETERFPPVLFSVFDLCLLISSCFGWYTLINVSELHPRVPRRPGTRTLNCIGSLFPSSQIAPFEAF